MRKEDCYLLGKITRKHGLSGQVVLTPDTDRPEMYKKMESIFIEINGLLVPFFLNKNIFRGNTFIISFKNISRNTVEQTIGKEVYLPLSTLPQLKGNQFYYHEVFGFEIVEENGKKCGTILSVNDQTLQHYFILDLSSREIIIPIVKGWIKEVNRDEKYIKMKLPEGLIDIFL